MQHSKHYTLYWHARQARRHADAVHAIPDSASNAICILDAQWTA